VPTLKEPGIPVVADNWRLVIAPKGLTPAQTAYWDNTFKTLASSDEWNKELAANPMANTSLTGALMIHTRLCDLLGIRHPIVLGGMGSATSATLVAAVSNAGGFGTLGTSGMSGAQITAAAKAIREATDKAPLLYGQDAGLIDSVKPVAEIMAGIVTEADEIIRQRLSAMLRT